MTEYYKYTHSTVEELAELLVVYQCIEEVDYDYEDESYTRTTYMYVSPSGTQHHDFESPVEDTIQWIKEDVNKHNDGYD